MRVVLLLVFVFTLVMPGFSTPASEMQKSDALQTQLASQIPFSVPTEQPYSTVIAKVQFIVPTFVFEQIVDLPSQEVVNNPAILKNSYQHNVFYVLLTAKAP